jgi:hypothetical protein
MTLFGEVHGKRTSSLLAFELRANLFDMELLSDSLLPSASFSGAVSVLYICTEAQAQSHGFTMLSRSSSQTHANLSSVSVKRPDKDGNLEQNEAISSLQHFPEAAHARR